MFIAMYTKAGHFDGMTNALISKENTLTQVDKWGLRKPFDTLDDAKEAIKEEQESRIKMLQTMAKNAFERNPKLTEAEYLKNLEENHPPITNIRYYKVSQVEE